MAQKYTITFVLLLVTFTFVKSGIPEQQDFGPILRPNNPTGARDILGYDNFQTIKQAKKEIKFGNHWEQYDNEPVQDFRFNIAGPRNTYDDRRFDRVDRIVEPRSRSSSNSNYNNYQSQRQFQRRY